MNNPVYGRMFNYVVLSAFHIISPAPFFCSYTTMPNDDGGIAKAENGSSAAPVERRVLFDPADATAAAGNNEDDELLEGGNGIGAEIASLQTGGRALASAEPPESFISSSSMSGG